MKNAILILLSCCALSAFGQGRGHHHQPVVNQGPRPTAHAHVGGGFGTNAAAVVTPTMTYSGGAMVVPTYTVMNQRVRYKEHPHGKYRWEIREERRCTPGYWVMEHGCRRWIAPRNQWVVVSKVKLPCGPHHHHAHR